MRISGINLPDEKRVDIGLTYLFGIGRKNVVDVLKKADVDASKRIKGLTEEEQGRIQKVLETLKMEGDLRVDIQGNIKRLREIGAYRGIRHTRNLPVRGQRTKTNNRTVRGNVRKTMGSGRKPSATPT